jgi:ribosomal protein S18 acetylase RimI-like enzyme
MSDPTPLRLWLEPGYDHGRFGVWLLDLPGAFGWAETREQAISQAPSAAGWYRDWTARHGEPLAFDIGPTEIVEEVPVTVADGKERFASFEADNEPVAADELDTAIRRLGYARMDLLEVFDRIDAFRVRGGSLEGDDRRSADDVAEHVARTEIWLASRLDPAARFPMAELDGDLRTVLAATRAWTLEQIRAQHDRDAALRRDDSRGEGWTGRKVMRRLLYHSIDHVRELDSRLARAERRTDRLDYRLDRLVDVTPLARLLRSVGWDRRTLDPDRLEHALTGTSRMVGAWDGDELVGFARDLGDGAFTGHISMVVIDPRWQRLGLGTQLVRELVEALPHVRFSLGAAGGLLGYYERLGFERDPSAMVRRPSGWRPEPIGRRGDR